MLYTKPINDITWDDIVEFCNQRIVEGPYLDYKQKIPTQLEKTISAMANTFGGIILIGIEEDNESKPKLPIKGIPFERGLPERITNIILTNITPPIFPEIISCKNESGGNAIIVIRIPESIHTPHAVSKNTKVYIRTGNVNMPEDLASLDKIFWLMDRRKKSIELREKLIQQANERFVSFYQRERFVQTDMHQNFLSEEIQYGLLTIFCCPSFPQNEFLNPSQLLQIVDEIKINNYFFHKKYFPFGDFYSSVKGTIIQDGIVGAEYNDDRKQFLFTEINIFGLYYYRQILKSESEMKYNVLRSLYSGGEILVRLNEFLITANNLYKQIGFSGYLDFCLSLSGLQDNGISCDWNKRQNGSIKKGFCPDKEINIMKTILASNIIEENERLIFDIGQKLFWAFDIELQLDELNILLKDNPINKK